MKFNPRLLLDAVYPVGSIYMSVNNTSPEALFGGKWEQLKDRFLLGAGDTYENGSTGGEATHKHTLDSAWANIGRDKVIYQRVTFDAKGTFTSNRVFTGTSNVTGENIHSEGSSLSGTTDNSSNMPPYLTVYIWKRTS